MANVLYDSPTLVLGSITYLGIFLSKSIYRLLLRQVLLNRETRKLLVRLEDGLARLEQIYKAIIIICISLIS